MKQREVVFSPEAIDDLSRLYDWIASDAGSTVALRYIERIETFCMGLELASQRGVLHEDIRHGLRVVGFERRLTVAFSGGSDTVTIYRLFYGGQNWGRGAGVGHQNPVLPAFYHGLRQNSRLDFSDAPFQGALRSRAKLTILENSRL